MAQEFVSRRDENREARGQADLRIADAEASEQVIALYPGESREIIVRVFGPVGHVVAVEEEGFPHGVASLEVMPKQAKSPYQAMVIVTVGLDAVPGVYPWKLRVADATSARVLGEEPVTLVVLPKLLPKRVAKHATRFRKVYEKHGIQVALWVALKILYARGATFSEVKALYELLTGRRVSKGTAGNTLKAMISKGLIERENGTYKALDLEPRVVLSRVDVKRVRYPWQVLKPRPRWVHEREDNILERYRFSLAELPVPVRRAYRHAQKIAENYGPLTGLYFLLYTLLGVRQTGHLLLWLNGWFIILEPKTGFAHHFYSWLLHWMLDGLGVREGVYYLPDSKEHAEAQRRAQQYVRKIYGSHQNARRLHYMLWERGYIWSDTDVYTIKVYLYTSNGTGVQLMDKAGIEKLYEENLHDKPAKIEVYTALPYRHVYTRNEDAYHYRPAGLF